MFNKHFQLRFLPRMKAITKKVTPKNTATPVMMWMKWVISLAMGVSPVSNPDAKPAIRPITVLSPIMITIPLQVPENNTEISDYHPFIIINTISRTYIVEFESHKRCEWQYIRHKNTPSTALVEKKAKFLVSRGFSEVYSGDRLWGSDSPVREELSTCSTKAKFVLLLPKLIFYKSNAKNLMTNFTANDNITIIQDQELTLKPLLSMTRISAGIRSPNLTSTMSPMHSSSAWTFCFSPSRRTIAYWLKEKSIN